MTELKDFLLDTLFNFIKDTEDNIHPKLRKDQVLDEWIREYDDLWEKWQEGPTKIADKLNQAYNRVDAINLLDEFFRSARPILAEMGPLIGERICMNENCLKFQPPNARKWCSDKCGGRQRAQDSQLRKILGETTEKTRR